MKMLTLSDVGAFVDSTNHLMVLTTTDGEEKKVYEVLGDEQSYLFFKDSYERPEIPVVVFRISQSDAQIYELDGQIHFCNYEDELVLRKLDFDYFIRNEYCEGEMMEEYQAKLCLRRGGDISRYLNETLELGGYKPLEIFTLFRSEIVYSSDIPSSHYTALHVFYVYVVDQYGNPYADEIRLNLDISNEDAMRELAKALIHRLLPANRRHADSDYYLEWMRTQKPTAPLSSEKTME